MLMIKIALSAILVTNQRTNFVCDPEWVMLYETSYRGHFVWGVNF